MSIDHNFNFNSDLNPRELLAMILRERGITRDIAEISGSNGVFTADEDEISYWSLEDSDSLDVYFKAYGLRFNRRISTKFRYLEDVSNPDSLFFEALVALLPKLEGDLGYFFQGELAILVRRDGVVYLNTHPDLWPPGKDAPTLPFPHERISLDFNDPFPAALKVAGRT